MAATYLNIKKAFVLVVIVWLPIASCSNKMQASKDNIQNGISAMLDGTRVTFNGNCNADIGTSHTSFFGNVRAITISGYTGEKNASDLIYLVINTKSQDITTGAYPSIDTSSFNSHCAITFMQYTGLQNNSYDTYETATRDHSIISTITITSLDSNSIQGTFSATVCKVDSYGLTELPIHSHFIKGQFRLHLNHPVIRYSMLKREESRLKLS